MRVSPRRARVVTLVLVGSAAVVILTAAQTATDVPWLVVAIRISIGIVSVLVGCGLVRLRPRGVSRDRHGSRHQGRGR
ncbi:hypothetical protein NI26_14460 [Curtobacterium sp. MR_MD2014]|nr:hypothetical protein NI26_14460 [Curtobacterium sp. MR_MD2014]